MEGNGENWIRSARRALGMTQQEFAYEIAATSVSVNRWENRHNEPSSLARNAIRGLLQRHGLDPDSLVPKECQRPQATVSQGGATAQATRGTDSLEAAVGELGLRRDPTSSSSGTL